MAEGEMQGPQRGTETDRCQDCSGCQAMGTRRQMGWSIWESVTDLQARGLRWRSTPVDQE